jgi:putative ABC transport system ATP-binding protein
MERGMITLKNVCKAYDPVGAAVNALDDVSLTVDRGEYLAVVGPSGSGKSTLFNVLGILDTASSGQYFLEDYEITALSDREHARIRNRHFGYVFQDFDLFSELSALENVMLPMSYAGVPSRRRRERAEALLREVGLERRGQRRPAMMSGVEQQRVAIARALANDPDLILADEPTGNLSSDEGEQILAMFDSLNAKGVTIVMVTHNPEQGARAKRRIHIRDGRLGGDESKASASGERGNA